MNASSLRLDQALVSRGLVPTRARARDAILRGHVTVGGRAADKPGMVVPPDAEIAVDDPAAGYVSRAALKLVAGLEAFGYDPSGRIALDLGASTGGFTEVLLSRGAKRVHAFDVGHGQLHPSLVEDPRVVSREGFNVRDLIADEIGEPVEAVVSDLSFISLRLGLARALDVAAPGAFLVALVKPQFEVGREHVGKGGLVRNEAAIERTVAGISDWIGGTPGWSVDGVIPSPIAGGDGNREFLLGARKVSLG